MVQTKEIFKQAIKHKGYALIDTFVPCVSMNKVNTFKWYKEHTYELESFHDKTNQQQAFARALETEKYPTGIFYQVPHKPTFSETSSAYKRNSTPLYQRTFDFDKLKHLIDSKRV